MLRHDNISVDAKPEPASDPLQPELEHSLAGCRREQRTTPVAAEGYEVGLAGLLKSLQSPRHRASLRPANSPLKPKDGWSWATRRGDTTAAAGTTELKRSM